MLNFIRVHAQGWIAWFIVGLISIPFALWGVNSYITVAPAPAVAKINGEKIPQAEYKQALQQYRDQMRTSLGEQFDPAIFDSFEVKKRVLDSLIEKKVLQIVSHDLGQRVSDKSIFNNIESMPVFQKDEQFDADTYNRLLARAGLTPNRFEDQLRGDMLRKELVDSVRQSTIVGDYALQDRLRLENQVREISYGMISVQEQAKLADVQEQAVQDYYDKHANNYLSPEQLVVDYVELSVDDLTAQIEVDGSVLQQFYEANKNQFVGPEQRQISHILIEQDEEQALETATIIKDRLQSGEDFAALAAEFSQDAGSEDGYLGLFQRADIEKSFEQAVFDEMNEGEVSELIKTEFGYHLVKLTKIQAGEGKSYTDAKAEVETMYKTQQAEQLFYEKAQLLADLSYENPEDLQITAEELELEIKTSPSFTRDGGTGIAAYKKVVTAAFGEDVLLNDLNSAVIESNKLHLLVLHKNKHTLALQLPFESVASTVRERLRHELAREQARELGEEIIAKIKAGEAAAPLFNEGDWQPEQLVNRTHEGINRQILTHVFSRPKPGGSPQYSGFTDDNGNYIVIKLSALLEGDAIPDSYPQSDGADLKQYLSTRYSESELQAFIASMKEEMDIEVLQQNL